MENNVTFHPVNTLVSMPLFDALKADAVDPQTSILSLSVMHLDECYLAAGVEYLKQMNESFITSKIKLYKAISEASDNIVVLESFSDYFVQVEAIISKFLEFIQYRLSEYFSIMDKLRNDSAVLNQYREALIKGIKNYEDDGLDFIKYTINQNVPNYQAIERFNASLFDDLFKASVNDLSVNSVKNTVTSTELEQDYAKFRGEILGIGDPLSDYEFSRALYASFREDPNKEAVIDEVAVKEAAERWFNPEKEMLNTEYSSIENAYKAILNKVSVVCKNNNGLTVSAFTNLLPGDIRVEKIDGKKVDSEGMMMSADTMLQLDIYCKAKLDQLQKYTDITCLAFMAKLDALKSMHRQDRNILMRVVDVIEKPENYGYDPSKASIQEGLIRNFIKGVKQAKKERYKAEKKSKEEAEAISNIMDANIETIERIAKIILPIIKTEGRKYYSKLHINTIADVLDDYSNPVMQTYVGFYYVPTHCTATNVYRPRIMEIGDTLYPDFSDADDDMEAWNEFTRKMDNEMVPALNNNVTIKKYGRIVLSYDDDAFWMHLILNPEFINKNINSDNNEN